MIERLWMWLFLLLMGVGLGTAMLLGLGHQCDWLQEHQPSAPAADCR